MLILIKKLRIFIVICFMSSLYKSNGQTIDNNLAIVVADNSTLNSAQELQSYLNKITNKTVPIITQNKLFNGTKFFIGIAPTGIKTTDDQFVHPEALNIINQDGNIYLYGKNSRTTSFAVYTFIENQLGVRWFAPGSDWTYIPITKSIDLNFKSYSLTPSISPRFWSSHAYNDDYKIWNTHNKTTNAQETLPWRSFQNNIYRIFPPDKYAKSHPEYYPLIDNKRKIPSKDDQYWWPCIGNKDVQDLTIAYINNYFEKNPGLQSFSLGMDDIMTMCECDLCKAMDSSPSDNQNKAYSDRYYQFINIIAKNIAKTYPNKYIGTLIYLHTKDHPTKIKKLEKNIFGYMSQDWAKWTNDTTKTIDKKQSKDWTSYMTHLSRYNYIGFNSIAPRVFPHNLAEGMKYDKSLNFEGMYSEIYTFLPHTAPMIWAFSKLQWDTKKDIDSLLNEFYTKMFENSSGEMKEYYDFLEKCWNTNKEEFNRNLYNNVLQQSLVMTSQDIDIANSILNKALSKNNTILVKKRIDIVQGGLSFYSYFVKELAIKRQIENTDLNSSSNAKIMMSLIQQLSDLSNERTANWNLAYNRNDLLGQNLMAFKQSRSFENDINEIENTTINNFYRLIEWYSNNEPNKLNQLAYALSKLNSSSMKASLTPIFDYVLLVNNTLSSSNKTIKTSAPLSKISTTSKNLLKEQWTTWSRFNLAHFQITNSDTKNFTINSVSENLDNSIETGRILQNVNNLKPGKKYLGIVWVKVNGNSKKSTGVSLNLRLRAGNSWLSSKGNSTQIVKSTAANLKSSWQPLLISITLPPNADGLSFMMSVDDNNAIFKQPLLFETN